MILLNLRPFGFQLEIEFHGTVQSSWADGTRLAYAAAGAKHDVVRVQSSWADGTRLAFLFGERHSSRKMKLFNVLNACRLVDAQLLGCAGTEIPMDELDGRTQEYIELQSRRLFDEFRTDDGVIANLDQVQPAWYGIFDFGNTLKVLRPWLHVRCVEDPHLRAEMKPIAQEYDFWGFGMTPHPYPDYPKMEDHPHNFKRENAMIDNLITLWDEKCPEMTAVLNMGIGHLKRTAAGFRERGISFITITQPDAPAN